MTCLKPLPSDVEKYVDLVVRFWEFDGYIDPDFDDVDLTTLRAEHCPEVGTNRERKIVQKKMKEWHDEAPYYRARREYYDREERVRELEIKHWRDFNAELERRSRYRRQW